MEAAGFHKRFDHVDCMVFANPAIQAFWSECRLGSIGSFLKNDLPIERRGIST
jgi:hypothetical protein